MKKIVSILLTVTMLVMSMGVFSVMADEATTGISPYADFDFSDYDGTAFKDKNGNLGNPWSGALPSVGTHTSPDGQTTVNYAQWDVNSSDMYAQLGGGQSVSKILDNNDVTVEMWVKLPDIADASQANKWPEFFNVTNGGTKLWTIEAAYDSYYNGYMSLNATNSGASNITIHQAADIFANKWAHVVTTRSYDTTTKWLYFKLYVNGVLMGVTSNKVESFTALGNSMDFGTLYWARNNAGKRFGGAFGQIRIYNTELTSSDILAKYDERKAIYQTEEQINYSQTEKFFNNYRTLRNDDWSNYDGNSAGRYWLSDVKPQAATHTAEDGTTVKYMQWNKEDELFMHMGMGEGAANILAHDSVTAEMWVKFPDIRNSSENNYWPLFYTVADLSGTPVWSLETAYDAGHNGYIALKGVSATGVVSKAANLVGGKWAHIVTSRTYTPATGTTVLKLYINGELMATVSEEAFNRGLSVNLGTTYYHRSLQNKKWSGGFGMLKMYNGELSESMIEEKYNEKKAIYQTMEDTAVYEANIANGTTDSISGHGSYGAWVNELSTADYDNGAGVSTKYFKFDGTHRFWSYGGSNQIPTKRFISNNDETSVEMWLNSNAFNNVNYRPFSIIDGYGMVEVDGSWYFEIGNGGIAQYSRGSLLGNSVISMDGKENQWFHVVATRDFNKAEKTLTYKTYIDGVLKDTYVLENQTSAYNCGESTGAIYIGNTYNDQDAYELFNGGIAKAKVYKSILTDAKVAALYSAEEASFKDAGALVVTGIKFEGEDMDVSINQLKGNTTVWCQVSFENSSKQEDKHYVAYGAIYDGDGKLVSIVELNQGNYYGIVDKATASGNGTATASYTWENLSLAEGSTLKVFIWSADEMMVPVSSEVYQLPWECA